MLFSDSAILSDATHHPVTLERRPRDACHMLVQNTVRRRAARPAPGPCRRDSSDIFEQCLVGFVLDFRRSTDYASSCEK
ncbi:MULTISPECIES: hypothetical protein [Paraburkholderia]|jgi:hypothetical protein|uniref:hypothetical protein n=1 Tax=Paraburkholderia TaxID=1822464 RepID=UPI0012680ECD|nr:MULTISPECIES: hypothetical protein [Paraburkholderia]WEY39094.1 hypothetical protein P2869_01560 [Paraburkholderia sp. SUR17]